MTIETNSTKILLLKVQHYQLVIVFRVVANIAARVLSYTKEFKTCSSMSYHIQYLVYGTKTRLATHINQLQSTIMLLSCTWR